MFFFLYPVYYFFLVCNKEYSIYLSLFHFKSKIEQQVPYLDFSLDPNNLYSSLSKTLCNDFDKIFVKKFIKPNNKLCFSEWATRGIRNSRDHLYYLYDFYHL